LIKSPTRQGTTTSGELLAVIDEKASAARPAPAKAEPRRRARNPRRRGICNSSRRRRRFRKASPAARRWSRKKLSAVQTRAADATADLEERRAHRPGSADGSGTSNGRRPTDQRVPMSRLRARIAQRLVELQSTAAPDDFQQIDMQASRAAPRYRKHSRSATACGSASCRFRQGRVEALRRFPVVNASVEGSEIAHHE
jgi:2-oxoglutarate dehydrogenase E2 component (dihydrolipoamide succinyltransferase)